MWLRNSEPTGPPLFALIIGINAYSESIRPSLKGAVADADSIDNYLRKDLNVPSHQICNLRDLQATRKGIIEALEGIAKSGNIQRGDPILIYYAGHGTSTENKEIQMLVPQDYCTIKGQEVPGIQDHEIGELVNDIAEEKGDNIVCGVAFINCNSI